MAASGQIPAVNTLHVDFKGTEVSKLRQRALVSMTASRHQRRYAVGLICTQAKVKNTACA
jgi:hypothetical protein